MYRSRKSLIRALPSAGSRCTSCCRLRSSSARLSASGRVTRCRRRGEKGNGWEALRCWAMTSIQKAGVWSSTRTGTRDLRDQCGTAQIDHNDSELRLFCESLPSDVEIRKAIFEWPPQSKPLSWHLTPDERASIKRNFDYLGYWRNVVKDFLTSTGPAQKPDCRHEFPTK